MMKERTVLLALWSYQCQQNIATTAALKLWFRKGRMY